MRAGFGIENITPPEGVELAGYGYYLKRRATRVLDPLFARALYVQADGVRWLVITCDLLGLSRAVAGAVYEGLQARHGLTRGEVMLVSIHTHTGPAVKYHEGCGKVDPAYVDSLAQALLCAAEKAIADADDVMSLHWREGALSAPFAYNRAAEDGPVDPMVRGFVLLRETAAPIAVVSYACHPVARGRIDAVSADYPGRVCALLDSDGFHALFLGGLCGDIDPLIHPGEDRDEQLEAFATAVRESFGLGDAPLPLTLQTGRIPHTLRLKPLSRAEIQKTADEAIRRSGDESSGAARVAAAWAHDLLARELLPGEEAIDIAWARLGGVWIVAFPLEGFTQTGRLLRQQVAPARVLTLGCAEELLGYLPTRDDIRRKAYAALESVFLYKRLPAQPGEAERLGEAVGRALRKEAVHAGD